jgi:hypothetical protein
MMANKPIPASDTAAVANAVKTTAWSRGRARGASSHVSRVETLSSVISELASATARRSAGTTAAGESVARINNVVGKTEPNGVWRSGK